MGKHSLLVRYPPALSSLLPELILHSEAIERADQLLGTILGTLEEAQIANETLVLVTADHGGAGSHHGAFNNENIRVPFLAKGPNVRKNFSISSYVRNMDTSPTALAALGVEAPDSWVGRAADIFVSVDAAETVSYDDAYSQRVKRIFLVGVAGLTTDAAGISVASFHPALSFLKSNGVYAGTRAAMPFVSFPNWMSLLTGVGPEEHGVVSDLWQPPPAPAWVDPIANCCDTILEDMKNANISTTVHFSSPVLTRLFSSTWIDLKFFTSDAACSTNPTSQTCAEVDHLVSDSLTEIQNEFRNSNEDRPSFHLLQFGSQLEHVGEVCGYSSPEYQAALQQFDSVLGKFITHLPSDSLLLLVATHGGVGHLEDVDSPGSSILPLFAFHQNLVGGVVNGTVKIMDVAATIRKAFRLSKPPFSLSKPLPLHFSDRSEILASSSEVSPTPKPTPTAATVTSSEARAAPNAKLQPWILFGVASAALVLVLTAIMLLSRKLKLRSMWAPVSEEDGVPLQSMRDMMEENRQGEEEREMEDDISNEQMDDTDIDAGDVAISGSDV